MITVIIILITVVISWKCFSDAVLFESLSLRPSIIIKQKKVYRMVTHAFVHNDWQHLLFNMFTLFFMGKPVEQIVKATFEQNYALLYLLIYFGGAIFASLYSVIKQRNNTSYCAVGASGAVSAIVFSFILFEPLQKLYLFALPIGIPSFVFGILFLIASLYLMKKNNDAISHDAHISGAIWGFVLPIIIQPELFPHFINQILNFNK